MTNAQINKSFLSSQTLELKNIILLNISKHYNISFEDVESEIYDSEAENIMDYVSGSFRATVYGYYLKFISNNK
jgi:hypothetical protein